MERHLNPKNRDLGLIDDPVFPPVLRNVSGERNGWQGLALTD